MDIVLGYFAGLLTLINPCVLPVLPIVLAGSIQRHRLGPVMLAAGMSVSYVALGLFVASIGPALGIYEETVVQAASVVMIGFGLILMVPRFSGAFATATAGFSARADSGMTEISDTSLSGQFAGGVLLGAVWSPCIGPTLGAAIGLASGGGSLVYAGAIMVGFAAGISTLILAIAYSARSFLARNRALMQTIAQRSRPVLGAIFVIVGFGIFFKIHHVIDAWAIQNMPAWLVDLSVSI